jgi:hypothetical protein
MAEALQVGGFQGKLTVGALVGAAEVKCFSITQAPRATAATEAVVPRV